MAQPNIIKLDGESIRMVEEVGRVKYAINQRRWRTQILKMIIRDAYRDATGVDGGIPDRSEEEGLVE